MAPQITTVSPPLPTKAGGVGTQGSAQINPNTSDGSVPVVTSRPDIASTTTTPASTSNSSSSSVPTSTNKDQTPVAGIAGAAAGCLIGGLIIGALISMILLRKKFNRRLQNMERRHDAEKDNSPSPKALLYTAPYGEPSREVELEDARKRIKALELERNSASAFGDTLDGHSEQELLDSPTFGLKTFNEKLHQLAMAISVSSNAGIKSNSPPPKELGEGLVALERLGRDKASREVDIIVRHVINAIIYNRICAPFCFIADAETSNNVARINKRVERQFDQAMASRWRIMSHKTLEQSSEDPTGKSVLSTIQQSIFDALVQSLLWAGVQGSQSSASTLINKNQSRIVDLTRIMTLLMTTVRQDMATATYNVDSLSNNTAPIASLGLSARSKGSSNKARIILDSK